MAEKKYRWTLPIKLPSPNQKFHWATQYRMNKKIEKTIRLICSDIKNVTLPCHVILTRCSSGSLDYDNCVYSLKKSRDVIADLLIPGLEPGQADSDKRIKWFYGQKKTKSYGLIIDIEET